MSAWREALDARDDVVEAHGLDQKAATTCWLDGIVGGRLGVRVTLEGGREVKGTPREIGPLAADLAPFPAGQRRAMVVAGRLEARIRRGEFGEGGKIPPARELMAHYGVSLWVVSHARRELIARGVAYSAGPHGTYAITQAPAGEASPPSSPAGREG